MCSVVSANNLEACKEAFANEKLRSFKFYYKKSKWMTMANDPLSAAKL
jgi:hypothetical protein